MKKILCLTTSPTVGGNGDALVDAAEKAVTECGAEVQRIDVRSLTIHPCKGCYGCAKTGVCVQKDDMAGKNAKKIQEYIKHQLDEDKAGEQMTMPNF